MDVAAVQQKVALSIVSLSVPQEESLYQWVQETYADNKKMMDNQLYQLKLKLVKWRAMQRHELKAGDLTWEGILNLIHK